MVLRLGIEPVPARERSKGQEEETEDGEGGALMVWELLRVWEGVGGTLVGKFSDLSKKMYLTKSNTARAIVTSYRCRCG